MSGYVGIFNLDGEPVGQLLLERMTQALAFRGPDAQGVWRCGPVGLGHSLLHISFGTALEKQPTEFDGRLWIVADARIDARAELIEQLKAKSRAADSLSRFTPDAELILHAYGVWGKDCVEHLLGDFSFAIWDASEEQMFCGRDQFGVKPFYYARVGSCFIFSNTLNCVHMHPAVSHRLNDQAIGDFLLFDMNQDLSTTSFADIRRLPPAHVLVCKQRELSVRRYWELRVRTPVCFRREEECIERFLELLDIAVADRLRAETAGVLMSGGLDSTTVAASAQRILIRNGHPCGLRAHTEVFDSLIPHDERHYATIAADSLGIPIEYLVSDDSKIFEHADQPEYGTPEPTNSAWPDTTRAQLCQLATRSRIALTGYGGDPALCGRITVHFRELLKRKQLGQFIAHATRYLWAEGRFSRLYISTRWQIAFGSEKESPFYPRWLNETFERKLDLNCRWKSMNRGFTPISNPSVRSEAYDLILEPFWANLFESHDTGYTKVPVEVCHPIFDLRLLTFLLGLPRLPWCSDKELFREAARGILPNRVRLRHKTPLRSDLVIALLNKSSSAWVDRFNPLPELRSYVDCERIPKVSQEENTWKAQINLRPISLNFWLRQMIALG